MSFFGRIAARAGAPSVPRIAPAVPKGMAARAPLRRQEMAEEEEMQTLRRQEAPEEEEMQTLRRVDEAPEEEMQPLRRQAEEEEEMQTLRRQEGEEEEEAMQALRRQPEEEEEMQPLRRQEEEEEPMQAIRRQEPQEEEMQMLRRQEEEEEKMQALRRREEEEEMQTLRRLDEAPEEEMQPLRRQEEEEEVQPLRRQAVPPDAAAIEPETSPKPPSFSALPDEPREMRGLRRDVASGETAGAPGVPSSTVTPGAEGGAEADIGQFALPPPFWPGEPSVAFDPSGFVPEPRRPAEARPRVVIEHMDVVISEPAGRGGGARPAPDLGRRLKSRYLRGL